MSDDARETMAAIIEAAPAQVDDQGIEWLNRALLLDAIGDPDSKFLRAAMAAARADALAALAEPETVEAAAREAFWTDDMGGHHKPGYQPHTWDNIPEVGRENYRTLVRAVIAAALRAAAGEVAP